MRLWTWAVFGWLYCRGIKSKTKEKHTKKGGEDEIRYAKGKVDWWAMTFRDGLAGFAFGLVLEGFKD